MTSQATSVLAAANPIDALLSAHGLRRTAAPLVYAALSGTTSMGVAFMLLFAMSGCAGLALLLI